MNLGVEPQSKKDRVGKLPQIGNDAESTTSPPANPEIAPSPTEPAVSEPKKMPDAVVVPEMAVEPCRSRWNWSADNAKWRESMNLARKALDTKDFKQFADEIQKALKFSANSTMEEQCRRLDKFGQLYEKGNAVINDSLSALKAADQIHFGTAGGIASVVEKNGKELKIKAAGEIKTYALDQISTVILMGIIEPRLNDSAMDQAIRGIVLSFYPKNKAATKEQAKEYFEKAAALDETFAKLEDVPQEKY